MIIKEARDLATRRGNQQVFARALGAAVDQHGYFKDDGRFLALHFDLMESSPGTRAKTRGEILGFVTNSGGARVTSSVFFVPIPDGAVTDEFALGFWNELASATRDQLAAGDEFYVHYAGIAPDHLTTRSQVVAEGECSLVRRRPR